MLDNATLKALKKTHLQHCCGKKKKHKTSFQLESVGGKTLGRFQDSSSTLLMLVSATGFHSSMNICVNSDAMVTSKKIICEMRLAEQS